jgi:hypothetical protein
VGKGFKLEIGEWNIRCGDNSCFLYRKNWDCVRKWLEKNRWRDVEECKWEVCIIVCSLSYIISYNLINGILIGNELTLSSCKSFNAISI